MIIIIGGAPGAGKTTQAKQIVVKGGYEHIELDKLMPKFNTKIPDKEFSKRLPVWYAKKTGLEPKPSDYSIESRTYWSDIRLLINNALESTTQKDFVIEGAQLSPELLREWFDSLSDLDKKKVGIQFISGGRNELLSSKLCNSAIENGFNVSQGRKYD